MKALRGIASRLGLRCVAVAIFAALCLVAMLPALGCGKSGEEGAPDAGGNVSKATGITDSNEYVPEE